MEELLYKQKNLYDTMSEEEKQAIHTYCEGYKTFLGRGKTERSCVRYAIELAEAAGFVEYHDGLDINPGTKTYVNNRNLALYLAVIGTEPLSEGLNIAAAHIDSPKLDLKPLPLYEDSEFALFKTHYYGGLRKHQWVTVPLSLHGVVITRDGKTVEIAIGDDPADPCFTITDLLPHLSKDQNKKTLSESFSGEGLNVLIGSEPWTEGGDKDRVKLSILRILHERYGITEEDLLSAELTFVPAYPARDVGLDRSLIGAYGQDDRACAYAALRALFDIETPDKAAIVVLADKEETGSNGVSGMKSHAFECFVDDLCAKQDVKLTHSFANSFCLSMDVSNGYDPNYPEVSEKRNSAKLNYGVSVLKYTGACGKGGTSDASAETVGKLRRVFDKAGVTWQMAELGKVDQGGGGTVAMYMAERNIDTIDAGIPLLSTHSPFEIAAKADCYMAYRAALALFREMK